MCLCVTCHYASVDGGKLGRDGFMKSNPSIDVKYMLKILFTANSAYGILFTEAGFVNIWMMKCIDFYCTGFRKPAQYLPMVKGIFIGTVWI
jgi:hypothetical protein